MEKEHRVRNRPKKNSTTLLWTITNTVLSFAP